jgi:hypothetical protein
MSQFTNTSAWCEGLTYFLWVWVVEVWGKSNMGTGDRVHGQGLGLVQVVSSAANLGV